MLTKNYKRLISSLIAAHGATNPQIQLTDAMGNTVYLGGKSDYAMGLYNPAVSPRYAYSTTGYGVAFGSDDTTPTEDDYILGSILSSSQIAVGEPVRTTEYDDDGNITAVLRYTITNVGQTEVTICEVGSFQSVDVATSTSATTIATARAIMFDHTVMQTPLVIPAGMAAVLEYRLKAIIP